VQRLVIFLAPPLLHTEAAVVALEAAVVALEAAVAADHITSSANLVLCF
jgi:hypothetical protein